MWIKKSTYNALRKELEDNKEASEKTNELTEKLSAKEKENKNLKSDLDLCKKQNDDLENKIEKSLSNDYPDYFPQFKTSKVRASSVLIYSLTFLNICILIYSIKFSLKLVLI